MYWTLQQLCGIFMFEDHEVRDLKNWFRIEIAGHDVWRVSQECYLVRDRLSGEHLTFAQATARVVEDNNGGSMKPSAIAIAIVIHAAHAASKSKDGTFFLKDVVRSTGLDIDDNTLYGYTGNPGLVGVLKSHMLVLHEAISGRFVMVPGWEDRLFDLV